MRLKLNFVEIDFTHCHASYIYFTRRNNLLDYICVVPTASPSGFAFSAKFVCKAIKVQFRVFVIKSCYTLTRGPLRLYSKEVSREVPDVSPDDRELTGINGSLCLYT